MKKQRLLDELNNHTLIGLKPSSIDGIGVFALVDIAKGTRNLFSNDKSEWVSLSKKEVERLPHHARQMIENFCLYDDENYFVPEYGFNMIDLVIYLNHSPEPNIISINDGEDFEALRDIQAGEELLIDYGTITGE